jgi:PAS domain-containing protein
MAFVLDDVIWAAGTGGVVVAWIKRNDWIFPLLSRFGKAIYRLTPGCKRDAILAEILYELKPNGGKSLKDSVNRIEHTQNELRLKARIMEVMQALQQNILNVAVSRYDEHGLLVEANQPFLNLLCLKHDEVKGKGWKNAIAEDCRSAVADVARVR